MTGTPKSQRRTLLKAAGALTGIGALGRMAMAQDTSNDGTTYQTSTVETSNQTSTTNGGGGGGGGNQRTIILGARVGHWLGLAPKEIEGGRNPTLGLIPTERYRIVWINLDGKEHEFQIIGQKNGENGQVLHRTGRSSKAGETRVLTFKPTDRIRRYRCRFHPNSMRGRIDRSGQFGGGGTFTTGTTNRGTNTTGTTGTYNTRTTGTYNTYTTETSNTGTTGTYDTYTTNTTDTYTTNR
ncbi:MULTISPECIES: hypothetical protein [unclassified Haladaptatus]|uniref:hypothetical protein n=1 Tax=unclassified Haladaptatus TaxID=2622732 RepID=UPI00209C50AA|nr:MULTISPECIES: hypothetical protein [unclassified Haladaptatus]MCO8242701.1 hypothetical protein [Haladaptatus sp. AB643]MCO8252460.1 hypothetical protein [Haladaptatus sp. AB618]